MLAQNVRGKAVGIGVGVAFGIGENIDLTVRLLKWLLDLLLIQPAAPCNNLIHRGFDWMPECYLCIWAKDRRTPPCVGDKMTVMPDGIRHRLPVAKAPDQPPCQHS